MNHKRLRGAARWYARHELEAELSPVEWQQWEIWSSDAANSAEYDEFVRLHRQVGVLARPALPSADEIQADVPRTSRLHRLPFGFRRLRYSSKISWRFVAAAAMAGAILLAVLVMSGSPWKQDKAATVADTQQAQPTPFSEATLQNLRASGRPVLVNLRADWCGTCVVNERTALSRESVRQMMERKRVAYLKGEWSDQGEAVLASLQRFRRGGVPLYLLYCPGVSEPQVLPQILTEDIVLGALSRLPDVG